MSEGPVEIAIHISAMPAQLGWRRDNHDEAC
jgi:hypothetical protein